MSPLISEPIETPYNWETVKGTVRHYIMCSRCPRTAPEASTAEEAIRNAEKLDWVVEMDAAGNCWVICKYCNAERR